MPDDKEKEILDKCITKFSSIAHDILTQQRDCNKTIQNRPDSHDAKLCNARISAYLSSIDKCVENSQKKRAK